MTRLAAQPLVTTKLASAALLSTSIALTLAATGCDSGSAPTSMPVSVGGKTFECRLSIDDATREKGMGGVASVGPDEGMLFAFPSASARNFWMRGCITGLDIAFIDPFGFVTAVHTMPAEALQAEGESESAYLARLKLYPSGAPAQYALEVAPGTLGPLGVKRGTKVEFDRAALKPHIR